MSSKAKPAEKAAKKNGKGAGAGEVAVSGKTPAMEAPAPDPSEEDWVDDAPAPKAQSDPRPDVNSVPGKFRKLL